MNYVKKQTSYKSSGGDNTHSQSLTRQFSDQRESTRAQLKQQQIMNTGATANIANSVAQLTSLNGRLVDVNTPYPNGNQATILAHMAADWNGAAGGAVTGGHILDAMVTKWGNAVANSVPNNQSPDGVHFAGAIPGNNITSHQHSFQLVRTNPGNNQTTVSPVKQSTFWPNNWTTAALATTLQNSWQNGPANAWASKENTSYWYRWQTLGANTVFPIEKVPVATGTLRNRMREGRG